MNVQAVPEWIRKAERRVYTGPQAQIKDAFAAELETALAEGYMPGALDWQGSGDRMILVVIFEYDPERAPRPL